MRLLHWQIFGGLATVGCAAALLGVVQLMGTNRELERRLERLEKAPAAAAPARPLPAPARTGAGTSESELVLARARAERLEAERSELERELAALRAENAQLKEALARLQHEAAGSPPGTGPALAGNPVPAGPPPSEPALAPPAPPAAGAHPVPPPSPSGEPWGASQEGEIERLAGALGLDQQQREEVRRAIIQGQNEFERRLIEASQAGERDITIIERIGEEISRRTEQRIRQLLRPEQLERFERYMQELRQN
ncbi:MAG: hypothetical protein KatS3mg102_1246 [Planctomycetota bacterium]|nr:MAG: hypothetical protein KatS3mg102_1246 [Planctomycetota bacterium]